MNGVNSSLHDFFREHCARSESLVLATIIETAGSTYRKAGAHMLIARDGRAAGLLSGGCLEPDLMARAEAVFASGIPAFALYDMRTSDDLIWGMGLGCEGAMRILLTRLDSTNDYQPFAFIQACIQGWQAGVTATVIESGSAPYAIGTTWRSEQPSEAPPPVARLLLDNASTARLVQLADMRCFVAPIELPVRLLVLGAGPDVVPVVEIAAMLGWQVSVVDHRPAYAVRDRFPKAREVILVSAAELDAAVRLDEYSAAVVMSHNLHADQHYLAALARSSVPYVGLLGPPPRRTRLLAELSGGAASLSGRLYGPIGLDIGAKTPEEIALAIASEIKAVVSGRAGTPFSRVSNLHAVV